MRKKVTRQDLPSSAEADQGWLRLEELAQVEVSSEEPEHPIESALLPGAKAGWRAAHPGPQMVRLIFDAPQQIARIWLRFAETEVERTQEFVLRWSPEPGGTFREIVRQQWNFSPSGSTEEAEDYRISLSGVRVLELEITPDKSGGTSGARASLAKLRLA